MSADRLRYKGTGGIQLSFHDADVTVIAVRRTDPRPGSQPEPQGDYMIEIDPDVVYSTLEEFRRPTDDTGPITDPFFYMIRGARKEGLPVEQVKENVINIVKQRGLEGVSLGEQPPYVKKALEEMSKIIEEVYTRDMQPHALKPLGRH